MTTRRSRCRRSRRLKLETPRLAGGSDPVELKNDETKQTETTPEVTRPRPLQVIRESLNFDPTKRPSVTRPSGDGPSTRSSMPCPANGPRQRRTLRPVTSRKASEARGLIVRSGCRSSARR